MVIYAGLKIVAHISKTREERLAAPPVNSIAPQIDVPEIRAEGSAQGC